MAQIAARKRDFRIAASCGHQGNSRRRLPPVPLGDLLLRFAIENSPQSILILPDTIVLRSVQLSHCILWSFFLFLFLERKNNIFQLN